MTLQKLSAEQQSSSLHSSDEEIVAGVLRGELPLFEILMRRYNQKLYRILRTVLRNDAEAEEVLQESYARAFFRLKEFSGRGSFAGWLIKIALHEAYAKRRLLLREAPLEEERHSPPEYAADEQLPQEQFVMSRELREVIGAALDQLPLELRTVFVLREVEQLSTAEVADCLAITKENVKVRLHRAKQALRTSIDRRLEQELTTLFEFGAARCDRVVAEVFRRIEAQIDSEL